MNIKLNLRNFFLVVILSLFITTSSTIAYSYFDGLNDTKPNNLSIGEWLIPISTAQEFYDAVSTSNSGVYYIANDIDFTGFSWNINSLNYNATFSGLIDGGNHTLSNLTISIASTSYSNLGIFPIIDGATIRNMNFDNVNMYYDVTNLYSSTLRAGILAGTVTGEANIIENISITNSRVRGSSDFGVGGLIGYVTGSLTTISINNIKTSSLKVFNKYSYSGGIIGKIDSSVSNVSISNVDISGEVFSNDNNSNAGGIIGGVGANASVTINNAIIEMESRNTLETNSSYYLNYSVRYLGGVIGENSSNNLNISNTFFTGSLVTESKTKRYFIGTLIGNNLGSYSESNNYYSMVEFRQKNGSINYYPDSSASGIFSILVNSTTLPNLTWWNNFSVNFDLNIWAQDGSGRLYLDI